MENQIAFETWSFGGTRFLAFKNNDGVVVMNQAGQNYGQWFCVEEFRKRQKEGIEPLLGTVCLLYRVDGLRMI